MKKQRLSNPKLSITNIADTSSQMFQSSKTAQVMNGSTSKVLGAKPGAVSVAALTEDNKIILTKQYRHPMGKAIYDLPAGGIHDV